MPVGELFRGGYLSLVVGLQLEDGREVVVELRPPAPRLAGCFEVHRRLYEAGFPCPQPLAGPVALAGFIATVESYIPGGDRFPPSGRTAEPFASALAALVAAAPAVSDVPSLAPNPPWTAWNHAGYTNNIRWAGHELHAVHDWDSLIAESEPVVAGLAAAVYPAVQAGSEATVEETAAFLDAYAHARGRNFSAAELEECWAASLWVRSFDAKKQFATEGHVRSLTPAEAHERAHRADAGNQAETLDPRP